MDNIQTFVNTALDGLPITEDEKKSFFGAFIISYYKSLLEYLVGAHATNETFHKTTLEFFNTAIHNLDEDGKKRLIAAMRDEKNNILATLLVKLQDELPNDASQRIEKNLAAAARLP